MDKLKGRLKSLKKDQLLIVILSGVLLLVIALPVTPKTNSGKQEKSGQGFLTEKADAKTKEKEGQQQEQKAEQKGEYTEEMEAKLEQILGNMEQVGKVKVILTLKTSEEKIVEKDMPIIRSNTQEQDSQGGNRVINNVDSRETTVYETDSGKSTPYVVRTTSPKVEGVVVVCEGAGTGSVSKNITEVIQVLFGIEPHKIKVAKMKTS